MQPVRFLEDGRLDAGTIFGRGCAVTDVLLLVTVTLLVDEFWFGARPLGTLAAEIIRAVLEAVAAVDARRWVD